MFRQRYSSLLLFTILHCARLGYTIFLNIPKYSLGAYSILNQLVFLSKWAAAPTYGVLLSIIRGIIQTRKSHPVRYHHH